MLQMRIQVALKSCMSIVNHSHVYSKVSDGFGSDQLLLTAFTVTFDLQSNWQNAVAINVADVIYRMKIITQTLIL